MSANPRFWILSLQLLASLLIAGAAAAQEPSLEALEKLDKEIEAAAPESLPAEDKSVAKSRVEAARAALAEAAEALARRSRLEESLGRAESVRTEAAAALAQWESAEATVSLPDEVRAAEAFIASVRAERDRAQGALDNVRQTKSGRGQRRIELPGELADARARLGGLDPKGGVTSETPLLLARAVAALATAERQRLAAVIGALEFEDRSLQDPALIAAIAAQNEARSREVAVLEARLAAATDALGALRRAEARDQEAEAEARAEQARDGHPLVALLSKQNSELTSEKSDIVASYTRLEELEQEATQRRKALSEDLAALKERVDNVGLTDAMGVLLRQYRLRARDATREAAKLRSYQSELGSSQIRVVELVDQWESLDPVPPLEQRIRSLGLLRASAWPSGEVPSAARALEDVAETLTSLLDEQRALVDALRADHEKRAQSLVRLIAESESLRATARELDQFAGERVLWIRSAPPIWRPNVDAVTAGSIWLVDPQNWSDLRRGVVSSAERDPVGASLLGVLFFGLLGCSGWARRRITRLGELASRGSTATWGMTLKALLLTLVVSLPFPYLPFVFGYWLRASVAPGTFESAAGLGFEALAWVLFAGAFLRQVVRVHGLAEAHFRWPEQVLKSLRANVTWSCTVTAPLTLALVTLEEFGNDAWRQSLGRVVLLLLLAVLGAVMWRMLHPKGGTLLWVHASRAGALARFRRIWFAIGVGLPAALALIAALGFQFTAVQLSLRLLATLGLALALLILNGMVLRALALARRDMAIRQAKAKREALKEAKAGEDAIESEAPELEDVTVDLGAIGEQMRSLVRGVIGVLLLVGAWLLWVDVLPALSFFRDVVFWSEEVDGVVSKVTLASFLLAAIYVVMTLVAARNLSGFLELVVLQRFRLQAGERHAVTTIARYVVLAIGFVLAFGAIGIGWSKVQFLVAALGVGLGFGLQEIFANFVSGIILLLERPIRVGDLVTVAGREGYVTKIRIRSTVVTDYDRRELIIPNKEFITGQIVNWSLSNPITRVTIRVGVAYGSDVRKVRSVLERCAHDCPVVLDEPKSRALFTAFGDSSLDFQLRVFLKSMDDWPALMNDIHTRIDDAFREEGLTIPFPQRDVHLFPVARDGEPVQD